MLFVTTIAIFSALTLTAETRSSKVKLYDRLLFAPSQHPDGNWTPAGIKFEDVWFRSEDGTLLHGWFCPHPKAKGLLIYAHGNAGHLAHRAPLIPRLQESVPAHVFMFDYRGYGRSEGRATVAGAVADAEAALTAAMKKSDMPLENTVYMGRSLGGAVMIQLAVKHPPRAMIIESSFSSLRDIGQKHFPGIALIVPKTVLNSVETLKEYKGPLFMSHGDKDSVIPFKQGKKLFDASEPDASESDAADARDRVFFRIQGANHNDAMPAAYYRELRKFMKEKF